MSVNHSLKRAFSSNGSTMRLNSPDIGGEPLRPTPRQRVQVVLRIAASVFALISMSLFAASISGINAHFINLLGNGDWTDGLALAPTLLSLILNSVFLVRSKQAARSPTPALRVGADFVIWGLAIPSIVYAVAGGIFWAWADAIPESDGTIDCSFWYNGTSHQCAPYAYDIGRMQMAGAVFLALVCVLHLALSVMGVSEMMSKKAARQSVMRPGFEMQFGKGVDSRPDTAA